MTKAFPAIMTQGIDEPCRFEGEVFDLEVVEGTVPTELDGLLVQAVPDQVFPPEVAVIHPMTIAAGGDGSVRAFRFKDGHGSRCKRQRLGISTPPPRQNACGRCAERRCACSVTG